MCQQAGWPILAFARIIMFDAMLTQASAEAPATEPSMGCHAASLKFCFRWHAISLLLLELDYMLQPLISRHLYFIADA